MPSILRLTRTRNGNLLGFAVALMLIMLTLVSALHHYQAVSRRATQSADAQIRMIQQRQWELARSLNKLPAGVTVPSDLQVSANLAITNSSTTIANASSSKMFQAKDGSGAWNGLPDVLIKRLADTERGAANIAIPPGYQGIQGRPSTTNPGYAIFNSPYRMVATELSPYAAYAPKGNVTLGNVVGWSNPPMGLEHPLELYSGAPAVVAAGRNVRCDAISYGTAYSGNLSGTSTPAINVTNGLVMPRVIGSNFPGKGFDLRLKDEVYAAAETLTSTCQALGDKTSFIDGEGPSVDAIFGPLFSGRAPALENMVGLNAAMNFPCPVIPGLSVVTIPLTYVALQFWFHAPFPPDGSSGTDNPFDAIKDKIDQVDEWRKQRGVHERRVRVLKGGEAPDQQRIHDDLEERRPTYGTGDFPPETDQRGLIKRYEDDILPDLQRDWSAMNTSYAGGRRNKFSGSELKTDDTMLGWMADFGPKGRLYSPGQDGSASKVRMDGSEVFVANSGTAGKVLYNQIMDKTWGVYETYPNPNPDNPSLAGKVRPDKDPVGWTNIKAGGTNTKIVPGTNTDWDQLNPGGSWPSVSGNTTLEHQLSLFKLLTDTNNDNNPLKKAKRWLADSEAALANLDRQIAAKEAEIDAYIASLGSGAIETKYPQTREEDLTGAKSDPKGMRSPPMCHSRFGYSFDIFYYLIESAIDGNLKDTWEPRWPMVFYGSKTTKINEAISTAGFLNIKSTFTVPQNRTFYYDNSLTIRGDLWLQRGSTMYVNENLEMKNPMDPASGFNRYNWFVPSGRIVMEEGSCLMVDGDLICAGTRERGSIVVTSQAGQLHPINAAIIADGNITVPHGVYNGFTFNDLLLIPDLAPVGEGVYQYFAGPFFNFVAPNMAKIWGPFHTRRPFFPRNATEYQFEVFIGPFGIPIPLVHPWMQGRKNIWVPLYKAFSFFYKVSNNFVMGENLYMQSDWWPFGNEGGVGRLPVVPKLDPSAVRTAVNRISGSFPDTPAEVADLFLDFLSDFWSTELLNNLKDAVIVGVVKGIALGNIPFAGDIFSDLVDDALGSLGVSEDALAAGPGGTNLESVVTSVLMVPFDAIKTKVLEATDRFAEETLADALAHEVAGLLLEGESIRIGVNKDGSLNTPPLMGSGLIVSKETVTLNVKRWVGSVISYEGSIKGDGCQLLHYPLFSRASLYMPKRESDPLIKRALDPDYGVMCGQGSGIDIGSSGVTQTITAEGWDL